MYRSPPSVQDHSPCESPTTVVRGTGHIDPPGIRLEQIENMFGAQEADNRHPGELHRLSAPVDRLDSDNLSELWLYVIQESLLRLLERGRVGPPRSEDIQLPISGGLQSLVDNNTQAASDADSLSAETSPSHTSIPPRAGTLSSMESALATIPAQVPPQHISRMPRSPGIEAEVTSRPDTFLVTPGHSPPPHEPSRSIPAPSRPLGLHLRQALSTGVPRSVTVTTTDTATTSVLSAESVPSQPRLHVTGVMGDGEVGQKWNQDAVFEGIRPAQAPVPSPGPTFPSQPRRPVPAIQPSTLDSGVILKLLRANCEEQQTILEQQKEILACLRGQRDVHGPHADALARLEQTLHKEVIPLMKQIAEAFAGFSPTVNDVDSQVPVNSSGGSPIRALNMNMFARNPEPSSSYGQFPVGGPAVHRYPPPTSEYDPEPMSIRRLRTELRSPSPESSLHSLSVLDAALRDCDIVFEAESNSGLVGSSDSQDAEETKEQTHYCKSSRGIDSPSLQQSPMARESHRDEATYGELDPEDDRDRIAERVLPLEGVARAMLETPPGPPTWTRGVESISDSEPVPQAQGPTWRVQPGEQDRIVALENKLAAMHQQLDSDRALRMTGLERQINSSMASWHDMLKQACWTTHLADMHLMNTHNAPQHDLPAMMGPERGQRPQGLGLNAAERQRIIFEGSIRSMTETWRADWERGKTEIIETIKAIANKQEVPYDIQPTPGPSTGTAEQTLPLGLPPEDSEGADRVNVVSPALPPAQILSGQCAQLARAVESSFADRSEDTPGMNSAVISPKSDAPASPSRLNIIDAIPAQEEQPGDTTPIRPHRENGQARRRGLLFFGRSKAQPHSRKLQLSEFERSECGKNRFAPSLYGRLKRYYRVDKSLQKSPPAPLGAGPPVGSEGASTT